MLKLDLTRDTSKTDVSFDEINYEYLVFKGGEPHITIKPFTIFNDSDAIIIISRINSFNDFGKLAVAVDALRRMLLVQGSVPKVEICLELLYFPGARQDRVANDGEALTVKVYADLINSLKFDCVTILDPHSSVTPALINNCYVIDNKGFGAECIDELYEQGIKDFYLVCPDAGAAKKINELASYLRESREDIKFDIVTGSKVRNTKTGELSDTTIDVDELHNKPCIIIDDICDGGRTFLNLAYKLKLNNAGKVYLGVTHGIFSYGFELLNKSFEMIYTTASIRDYDATWHEAHKHHKGFVAKVKEIGYDG